METPGLAAAVLAYLWTAALTVWVGVLTAIVALLVVTRAAQ